MRVAITGATGFVGSSLHEKLLNNGFACVPLVRDTQNFPNGRNYSFDMTANELENSLSGCTHLVHLAARVHHMVDQPNASEIYSIANEEATHRLAIEEDGCHVGLEPCLYGAIVEADHAHILGHPDP